MTQTTKYYTIQEQQTGNGSTCEMGENEQINDEEEEMSMPKREAVVGINKEKSK